MNTERNQPCPCGSGKKYKKCCLAKDEAAAREAAATAARVAEEQRKAEEAAQNAEWERRRQEWTQLHASEPSVDLASEVKPTSREPNWPALSEADQQPVDAWWEKVSPVYTNTDNEARGGWLLEQTLAFLDQQPQLFRYLDLHEEFLFELGAALARAGRMDGYLELLRRLRQEQPEMYFQCFGFFDTQLLADALRRGRREDIPACLDLFQQHPIREIDYFAKVVDLLAWRGCETELRRLLEPTAQTIADSPAVIGGDFGLLWLAHLDIFPFLEAGDDSNEALDRLWQTASATGFFDDIEGSNRDWLARAVKMSSRSVAEAHLNLKGRADKWLQSDVGWSFTGWVHRTKGLAWSSARSLGIALLDYWAWREKRNKGGGPFDLDEDRLDHYLAQCCRSFAGPNSVRALSTLQAFHYFTEYLAAHDYFSTADTARLQAATARLYEVIRDAVDANDSAYWICPTYEALIAAPRPFGET